MRGPRGIKTRYDIQIWVVLEQIYVVDTHDTPVPFLTVSFQ